MTEDVNFKAREAMGPVDDVADHLPDVRVAPAHGIAAMALSMAIKYHDITIVKDGAMYQQYKLEGRNMRGLELNMVFETAMQMEAWLLGASERISKLVIDAVVDAIGEDEKIETSATDSK